MKSLLFSIFTILSLSLFGQVQDTSFLIGKVQMSQSGAGSGYWQVYGTFTDESGLYDSGGIQVGDVLFFSDAGVGYHLPITLIVSATPPSFAVRVSNTGITNIISVPTGSGVIYRPSAQEFLTFAAGISNPDQQTYQSYLAKKLDAISVGGSVNTIYNSSDSLQNENHIVKMAADGSQSFALGYWPGFPFRNYELDEFGVYISPSNDEVSLVNGATGITAYSNVLELYSSLNYASSIRLERDSRNILLQAVRLSDSNSRKFYIDTLGFNVRSIESPSKILNVAEDSISFFNLYRFPKQKPSTASGVTNILKWTGGTPSFGEINNDYEVTITGGNTDSKLYIRSDVTGVTASFASNQLTITIPGNGKIHSADWRLVASDVQASADGGGVTNWVKVRFVNTSHNTSIADMRCPDVQKVAIPTSGALSETNAATYDIDSNPAPSVIDVGGNAITIRIGGLSVGGQGYNLKFSGI